MAILEVIGLSIGAFIATNIDDLFILMAFITKRTYPTSQIIVGQYVGMSLLLVVSLLGSLIALVIPHNLIGLVGLFPIAIGIKELVELRNAVDDSDNNRLSMAPKKKTHLPFLMVAAVTFSGGEEIGIYASIFAIYHNVSEIATIFILVMIFTGIWCMIALYLAHHSFLAVHFRKLSRWILPLVLVGIGIYILTEAFIISLLE